MNRNRTRLAGLGALVLLAMPALAAGEPADAAQRAQELDRAYPAGTIATAPQAERALAQAALVHRALQDQFDERRRACQEVFFVNHCLQGARDAQRGGDEVVRRVTLESHDLRRHADARLHAEQRAQELRRQAEADALRPQREREALAAAQARVRDAAARADDQQRAAEAAERLQAAQARRVQVQQSSEARIEQHRPGQEAAAQQTYRRKRADAAAYAVSKAADKKINVGKRTERQTEREARNREDAARASAAAAH